MTLTLSSKTGVVFLALCFSAALAKSGFMRSSSRQLSGARRIKMDMVKQEMDEALNEAMGHGHGVKQAEMEAKKAMILPMFESMPKNMYGHVGLDALQYMVHRYFGSAHGWSIRGFTPSGSENTSDISAAKILKQKLPRYIEAVLESKLENQGFSVTDVVTMVAVLERMIFDEGVEMLEATYRMLSFNTGDRLTKAQLTKVMDSYMLIYSFGASATNKTQHIRTLEAVAKEYPEGYPSTVFGQAELKAQMEQSRAENPFADSGAHSFDLALQGVSRANENYGRWSNEEECVALKEGLSELDRDDTGRVRIADFYAKGQIGATWEFTETLDYLRGLGVLDETSATRGPQLMIPNYVQSMSNCIDVSSFYSICCIRECEGLLGTIEREVQAPMATPAQIFAVTQRLIDAREETSRSLTLQLKAQLEAVAEMHDGKVPIHGRLFQQWLHYAFPYECPYPSKRDAVDAVVISEWTNTTGTAALYTAEEIQEVLDKAEKEEEAQDFEDAKPEIVAAPQVREMSAWTMEEELYVGYHHHRRTAGLSGSTTAWAVLGCLAKIGMVIGGLLGLGDFASKKNFKGLMMRGIGKPKELLV